MVAFMTDEYRRLNEELHQRVEVYGSTGHRWKQYVLDLSRQYQTKTLLDYGCGKGALAAAIGDELVVTQYDPAVPEHAAMPAPAEGIACTDVLEHIEPEYLSRVLAHILDLAGKFVFFNISTKLDGSKDMADGSNPHRIVHPAGWWKKTIAHAGFRVRSSEFYRKSQINIVAEPIPWTSSR